MKKKINLVTTALLLSICSLSFVTALVYESIENTSVAGWFPTMALDSNGFAHVSYGSSAVKYCNNTLGTWTCANVTTGGGNSLASLALDSSNKVHLVLGGAFDFSTNQNQLVYCNNTAGVWTCANITGQSKKSSDYHSIAIDTDDYVHLAYSNSSNQVRYCNNTLGTWNCLQVSGIDGDVSLALDSNNKAHIAASPSGGVNKLKYCNNTLGTWTCADASGFYGGIYNSIAIDSNNKAHVATYDNTNSALRYCNNTVGTWSCTLIETTGSIGQIPSIALDSGNHVFILHEDESNYVARLCENTNGTWVCSAKANFSADVGSGPSPTGPFITRSLAVKKGRIVDSTSSSNSFHFSIYNGTHLNYYSDIFSSCEYNGVGNWEVDCADGCVIGSNTDLLGNNISITGKGTFSTTANITNFSRLHIAGTNSLNRCVVTCNGGGCFKLGI